LLPHADLASAISSTSLYGASRSRLTGITSTQGTTTLGNLAYGFDALSRVSTVGGSWARTNQPAALTSATYDNANQVTSRGGVLTRMTPTAT
jgi:hypothetical protein